MLKVVLGGTDWFDESTNTFETRNATELYFEHSLVSLSKWEEIWEKPFLGKDEKTPEEALSYFECMYQGDDWGPEITSRLTAEHNQIINDYIGKPMTATWFRETSRGANNGEMITAELIYYWMVSFQIPFECQNWHLNKLFTLIKVCNKKNAPAKKMSKGEAARQQRSLNEARRNSMGSTG